MLDLVCNPVDILAFGPKEGPPKPHGRGLWPPWFGVWLKV